MGRSRAEGELVSISAHGKDGTLNEDERRGGSRRGAEEERTTWARRTCRPENALLIISPKGEELIPRKKPQPNYSRAGPILTLGRATLRRSDFIGPLICNVNPPYARMKVEAKVPRSSLYTRARGLRV